MDFTEDFWNSVSEDRKLKGNVHDVLAYQDFTQIVVLRCNMHIPAGNMLDRFIQDRFNKEFEFHVEALPEAATLDMRYPLLTALVETKCGDLALFNAYSQFSVLEFAGGIGVILTEQQGYPGKKQ